MSLNRRLYQPHHNSLNVTPEDQLHLVYSYFFFREGRGKKILKEEKCIVESLHIDYNCNN